MVLLLMFILLMFDCHIVIELDDGKIGTGKPFFFDGKNHGFL